ncbi:MAG TPA: ParB/RepB/Spo0J family partition protein [Prolixibacteraceae bacterium]|nr:ParB/RepB/Spo0J family partition protein [Prolixibacteraceae bacterium]HUM88607.1 ParB/RepB/Spo0J family partition protein [Prolixibacteraceae bacterium]
MAKKNVLGRGLDALIEGADSVNQEHVAATSIDEIEISKIEANPWQPRTTFDGEALQDLANSIKEVGIIQPLTLRKVSENKYQIIAGERRFRASKLAGLEKVPAFIRESDDDRMLELALIENIQREDLDAIEISLSYQRLLDECQITQEELSERVGKKRSTVANYLRLLKLPAVIQKAIRDREISMGHARAIINVEDPETQIMLFKQIVKYDFSVRKIEEIVRKINSEESQEKEQKKENKKTPFSPEYDELKKHLTKHFSTNIDFKINNKGAGKIVIPFNSDKDLERIIGVLDKLNN